jgi:hypothetical protein
MSLLIILAIILCFPKQLSFPVGCQAPAIFLPLTIKIPQRVRNIVNK